MSNVQHIIRLGNTGGEALHAKRSLNGGNVFGIDTLAGGESGPLVNTVFGPGAASATIEMKRRLGYKLSDIGPGFGPTLDGYLHGQAKLPPAYQVRRANRALADHLKGTQSRVLSIALSQVGYVESPVNITKYGQAYGMNGVAWCDEFISWVLTQAGLSFHYAYVPATVQDARDGRNGLRIVDLQKLALACFDWERDGTADHIGLVVAVNADHSFETIEGNTSDANWSNGGMVLRRTRTPDEVQAFVGVKGLI